MVLLFALKRFRDIRLICRKATGAVHAQDCESHRHDASELTQEQHHLFHFCYLRLLFYFLERSSLGNT